MTQEEEYLQWMEEYFSEDDRNNLKAELILASDNGKLLTIWTSIVYGRLGMYVRNYMRNAHPEIDSEFEYGKFEDYSWELIQKLVEKWKANTQSVEVQHQETDIDIEYSQEDKELLLKDLCARLPYDIKCCIYNFYRDEWEDEAITIKNFPELIDTFTISEIKPYLFPMSSMTEEQKEELSNEMCYLTHSQIEGRNPNGLIESTVFEIDFYNKHHIDYRGLIEKGLALDANGLGVY